MGKSMEDIREEDREFIENKELLEKLKDAEGDSDEQ